MITNESGRSLVETLGMLAIMGILSVVGMAGYNAAMDKTKANTIINEAQKRAVIIAGQIGFNGNQPSLAEFSPYDNGMFDSSHVYYKEDGLTGQFGIKVLNVKKSVCQNILNTIGEKTPIRRLSKTDALTTPITSCDDEADYVIIYNNDMTADSDTLYCSTNIDCDICSTCNQTTHLCVTECESECKEGDTCGENDCVVCDNETKTCQNKCEEVGWLESDGNSYILAYSGQTDDTFGLKMEFSIQRQSDNYPAGFSTTNNRRFLFWGSISYTWAYGWGTNSTTRTQPRYSNTQYPFGLDNFYEAQLNFLNDKKCSFAGNTPEDITGASQVFTNTNFLLFKSYSNAMPSRIKYATITKGNKIIRDFIPVLSPEESKYSGAPCMFDKVSKKLFCGTGTFDYGPKNNN